MPAGTFTVHRPAGSGERTLSGRPPANPAVTVEPISGGRWMLAAQGYVPVAVRQSDSEVHLVFVPSPGPAPLVGAELAAAPVVLSDPVQVDCGARTVHVAGRQLDLPRLEFDLLAYLISRPHHVHTRRQLIAAIWPDSPGGERTVDVHVARLRRRLGPQYREVIATAVGVGYKYVPLATP
ncbi:winged helix-turn-helix domain-containing protein [Streptomyces sp. A5-4]|uniref:winged helix-turn-helix domain-containing protein n=1 Tax=Streptomyces sp. A5-4 TaxID=3384771 RepID=UPI003DA84627